MKLPPFDADGDLPPGIHWADWEDIVARYGGTSWRQRLLKGLRVAVINLRNANCSTIYINGSFVTDKANPADYDACWEPTGVDMQLLDPILLDTTPPRLAQRAKYRGELFRVDDIAIVVGLQPITFIEFFQRNKLGKPKGIIGLDLRRI